MMPEHRWLWRASRVRMIDGDTIDFIIDRGFRTEQTERIRLLGVDTPEIVGATKAAGQAAMMFVGDWFFVGEQSPAFWGVLLETRKPKERDSFGRWLADVWRIVDGRNLAEDLIAAGHGVRWT